MPTQSTTYNTRLTDETLEARFRETFRSQGGAELVDDLYASGVIVPIVDFTSAAEGSSLRADLQAAWDFTTGANQINNTTTTLISNSGFWRVAVKVTQAGNSGTSQDARIQLTDGLSTKTIWRTDLQASGAASSSLLDDFVVFLRAGDSLTGTSSNADTFLDVQYRTVADVNGNLTNPSGFSFS